LKPEGAVKVRDGVNNPTTAILRSKGNATTSTSGPAPATAIADTLNPGLATPNSRNLDQQDAIALSKESTAKSSILPIPSRQPDTTISMISKSPSLASAVHTNSRMHSNAQGDTPADPTWSLRPSSPLPRSAESYEEEIAALHLLVSKIQVGKLAAGSNTGSEPPAFQQEPGSASSGKSGEPVNMPSNQNPRSAAAATTPAIVAAPVKSDSSTPVVTLVAAASQTEVEVPLAPPLAPISVIGKEDLDALAATKDAETKRWRIRAKRAEADLNSAKEDLQFFREQYQTASDSAVAEVAKSTDLEERMTILQGQLKHGLKQREMHTAAIRAQHEKEVAKLSGQIKILLAQSRLTDDAVRAKAVQFPRVEMQLERAEILLKRAERKIDSLVDRNDELLSHIEVLRAKQMGILVDTQDDSEDEDYASDSSSGSGFGSASENPPPAKGPATSAPPSASAAAIKDEDSLIASQLMPDTQDLGPASLETTQTQVQAQSQGIERKGQALASPWTRAVFHADESVSPLKC
jgi:hypothetical protein